MVTQIAVLLAQLESSLQEQEQAVQSMIRSSKKGKGQPWQIHRGWVGGWPGRGGGGSFGGDGGGCGFGPARGASGSGHGSGPYECHDE